MTPYGLANAPANPLSEMEIATCHGHGLRVGAVFPALPWRDETRVIVAF